MKDAPNRFSGMPLTKLGWWSAGLAIVFVVLLIINVTTILLLTNNPPPTQPTAMPNLGFPTILCGLTAGIVGSLAIVRRQECSWLIWLSLLSGVLSLSLLIGDIIAGLRIH
jgi:hypothetical protein